MRHPAPKGRDQVPVVADLLQEKGVQTSQTGAAEVKHSPPTISRRSAKVALRKNRQVLETELQPEPAEPGAIDLTGEAFLDAPRIDPGLAGLTSGPEPSLTEISGMAPTPELYSPGASAWQLWTGAGTLVAQAGAASGAASGATTVATTVAATSTAGAGLALGLAATGALVWNAVRDSDPPPSAVLPPADQRGPALLSITTSAIQDTITLEFDEALDGGRLPDAAAFIITQAGNRLAVSSLSVNGARLTLQLGGDLQTGAFTLVYTDPTSGDDSRALQDASGNDAGSLTRGLVADGYIYGASIYLDRNGDGRPQAGEDTGVRSAADGSFMLTDLPAGVALIAAGGVNIDTGLANTLVMSSTVGSTMINPLTTLVREMILGGAVAGATEEEKISAASAQLGLALGLPAGMDLSRYDPLADSSPTGLTAQKAAVKVVVLAKSASGDPAAQQQLVKELALDLADESTAVSLVDASRINALLTAAGITGASGTNLASSMGRLANATSIESLADVQSSELGLPVATGGAPAAAISVSKLALKAGESSVVSIAFSEAVQGLELSDLSVTNGRLSALTALPGGRIYTTTLSPLAEGPIAIELAAGSYTNTSGQAGSGAETSPAFKLDLTAPTVDIEGPTVVRAGQTALIRLVFDDTPSFFDSSLITVSQGSLSPWTAVSGLGRAYTALFTPTADIDSQTVILSVPSAAYADAAGNPGQAGILSFTQDTRAPVLSLSSDKAALKAGETASLTLSFSEPVQGLTLSDLFTDGKGRVSNLQSLDALTYRATFTPDPDLQATAPLSVAAPSYVDAAGNPGSQNHSLTLAIDTLSPTLRLSSSDSSLKAGDSSTVTFTFSEAVQGFVQGDVLTTGGTLSAWQEGSGVNAGKVFTATFTPDPGFEGTGTVSVLPQAYKDLAGNPGVEPADRLDLQIDLQPPQIQSLSAEAAAGRIEIGFDGALDASAPPPLGAFQVIQGGRALTVSAVQISGSQLRLTVAADNGGLQSGVFALSYTNPAGEAGIRDLAGNESAGFTQGIVADGYIRGARIHIDANRNGLAEAGEDTGITTRADGSFVLLQGVLSGPILAVGGVNTDTGVPNTLVLSAPAGTLVVNPLTTLVEHIARSDTSDSTTQAKISAAEAKVSQALGLGARSLLNFDPLAAPVADLAVQKAAATVATLVMASTTDKAQQATLMSELAQAVEASAAPLSLSSPELIAQLLLDAGVAADPAAAQTLAATKSASIAAVANATELSALVAAQSLALDTLAPALPLFKQALPGGVGILPQLTFAIDTAATDGSAVSTGDLITVQFENGASFTHSVTGEDLNRGMVSVLVEPGLLNQAFRFRISDEGGRKNESSLRPATESDPSDLGQALSTLAITWMQGAAQVELPVIGSLDRLIEPLSRVVLDALSRLPKFSLDASTPALMARAAPMAAFSIEADPASADDAFGADTDFGPMLLMAASYDDPFADWGTPSSSDAGWDDTSDGDASSANDEYDPWPDLGPAPAPIDPGPYVGPNPSPGPAPSPPSGKGNLFQNLENEIRAWARENLGIDFDLDLIFDAGYDAMSGKGGVHVVGILQDLKLPLAGDIGWPNLGLAIDAEFDASAVIEFMFQVEKVTEQVTQDDTTVDRNYWAIDTEKSGLNVYLGAGLTPGSTAQGSLGPIRLSLTDQESARALSTATRTNTALEASVELRTLDNDDKPDDGILILSKDTLDKFFEEINTGEFKLSDWYSLQAGLEGRISGEAQLMLDFGDFIEEAGWGGNAAIDAVANFLRLNLTTDLTIPLSLQYDSTQATTQDYGRIYFDNVRTGFTPLISDKIGPVITLTDKYLGWLYDFKDLMYQEAPIPQALRNDPVLAPITLPSAASTILPGSTTEVGSLEYDIYQAINKPITGLNQAIKNIRTQMDANSDGTISNFEVLKSTALFLYQTVSQLQEAWDYVNSIPGLKSGLASTPYGSAAAAIIEGVLAAKPALEAGLQGVLIFGDLLDAVDQLHSVSKSFAAASQDASAQGLQIKLGSHVFDFKSGSLQTLNKGVYTNVLDYLYPLPDNPEPGLTYEQAIARILKAADDNNASVDQPNPGSSDGWLHPHVFITAELEGITQQNAAALVSMINSAEVNSAQLKLNKSGAAVRAIRTTDTDSKNPHDGIQDQINAYLYLLDLVGGKPLNTELYYEGLKREEGDSQFDKSWYIQSMDKQIKALGLPGFTTDARADYVISDRTLKGHLNSGSMAFFYDILDAQSFRDIDTYGELKALWSTKNKMEDINGFSWASEPKPAKTPDLALTSNDLQVLKVLSRLPATPDMAALQTRIAGYDKVGNKFYDFIKTEVSNNTTTGTNLSDTLVLEKIRQAALDNTARAQGLTLLEFSQAGVKEVNASILPLLLDQLDLVHSGESTWVAADFQKVVDRLNNFRAFVSGSGAWNHLTDDAVELSHLINGNDSSALKYHEALLFFESAGIKDRKYSLQSLLLRDLLEDRTWQEVDSQSELEAVVNAILKTSKLTYSDPRLYLNLKSRFEGRVDGNYSDKTEDQIREIVDRQTASVDLSAADLAVIGFPGLSEEEADKVAGYLRDHLYAGNQNSILKSDGVWIQTAKLNPKLTSDKLSQYVQTASVDGWYAELMDPGNKGAFATFFRSLIDVGFDFPILRSPDAVGQIFNWFADPDKPLEVEDLVTFSFDKLIPEDLTLSTSLNKNLLEGYVPAGLSLDAKLQVEAGLVPRLKLGIDTLGIASLVRALATGDGDTSVLREFPNSFYLADKHLVSGELQDVPELEAWFKLVGSIQPTLGSKNGLINGFVRAQAGADFDLLVDLEDPDGDGKARLMDLIDQAQAGGFRGIFDIDSALSLNLGLAAGLNFDFTPTDGLPKDWSAGARKAVEAAIAVYEFFGGTTEFTASAGKIWDFPIYDTTQPGQGVFGW